MVYVLTIDICTLWACHTDRKDCQNTIVELEPVFLRIIRRLHLGQESYTYVHSILIVLLSVV